MRTWTTIGAMAMCVAMTVGLALAQPAGRERGQRRGEGFAPPPGQDQRMDGERMGQGPHRPDQPILGALRGLNLTAEQQPQVRQAVQQLQQALQDAQTPEARRDAMGAFRDRLERILTPEQLQQFRRQMGPQRPGQREGVPEPMRRLAEQLNLTPEQREQLQAAHEAFRQRVQQILTPEQREQFRQLMSQRRGPGGFGPRDGVGPQGDRPGQGLQGRPGQRPRGGQGAPGQGPDRPQGRDRQRQPAL